MTTLHRVTEITKKIIIGFSIGIGSILFLFLLFRLGASIKEALFPTPPAPPTISFGKLPDIMFAKSQVTGNFTYTLNTLTGSLPNLGDRATVYAIAQPQANLLSFSDAQQLLNQNGFTGSAKTISESVYSWQQSVSPYVSIQYNIVSKDFTITSQFASDQNVLSGASLPQQNNAASFAQQILTNYSAFPDDIDATKTTIALFDIQNGNLIPASSLSTAKVEQVNFFQKEVNSLPIVYPNTPDSTMQIQIGSGANNQPQVIGATFFHKKIDTSQSGTYPIITTQQAFDLLKSGKGYVAHYDGTGSAIVIKNVFLAYYLGETDQKYAMPVIVFQGDNNFYAFVSAVTDSLLQK